MFSLACFGRCFTFHWRWFSLTAAFFIVLISLGGWQLSRAEQKQSMLARYRSNAARAPVDLDKLSQEPAQYQRLKVTGKFLNKNQILLDNQYHQHQWGYHVLTPLSLNDGSVLIIDRGWVKGDFTRRSLPKITAVKGRVNVWGQAYYPSAGGLLLGSLVNNPGRWPCVIERLDTKAIAEILHRPVLGFIMRQQSKRADGYVRQWSIVSMPPGRHRAYAVQWFAMALVVLILFIALNRERE